MTTSSISFAFSPCNSSSSRRLYDGPNWAKTSITLLGAGAEGIE